MDPTPHHNRMSSEPRVDAPPHDWVGQGLPREGARRYVAGRGRYTDDLRVPGLLHAAFLRSPWAHARWSAPDLSAARALPGVRGVWQASDLAGICQTWTTALATLPQHRSAAQGPLADGQSHWQGQPVVLVVATSRAVAEDAMALIDIAWEECPPVVDAAAALQADSPLIHPSLGSNLALAHQIGGDSFAAVAAKAHCVVQRELVYARHTGVPLEGRAIIAEFDPSNRNLTVHQSTQVPQQMRALLAQLFGLRETDVRVLTPDVGGAFGIKLHVYDDEMATVAASVLLGQPVKFISDRFEAFNSDVHARSHRVNAQLALDAQGQVLGFAVDDLMDIGAYSMFPRTSVLEGMQTVSLVGAPYAGAVLQAQLRVAYQNKAPVGAYRGVGQPVACAITEQLMDAGAAALGLDPAELRRRNYRVTAQHGATGANGMDLGGLSHHACLERLLELMDYPGLRAQQLEMRAQGRHLGLGLAAFVELTAPGPAFYGAAGAPITAQDGCVLRLEPDGGVTCMISSTDQGQGIDTVLQQLLAQSLHLDMAAVRVVRGDTHSVPAGGGTWASRGMVVGGEAALLAAQQLLAQLTQLAAAVMQVDATQVEWQRLAQMLHFRLHELPAGVQPQSFAIASASAVPQRPFMASNGIQASWLEVDTDTGFVTLLKHWVVEDCGRVLNPLLADEQLRGGVVQGIGAALFEECRYDEQGQHVTSTLADYLVPMAGEMPDIVIAHLHTPVTHTLLGAKGIGEAGTIGAGAAVANAVHDALAPWGVHIASQPYTPEIILQALGRVGPRA
jgi:carbon-monoxide dehydrogenase large subunit